MSSNDQRPYHHGDLRRSLIQAGSKMIEEKGLAIPVVVGGSVITKKDEESLKKLGVAAAFGPNSTPAEIIEAIKGMPAA